ncbi:MAG: DASH family cryptochrome [Spirochaeta sp.]|nr:DASH family cryptochrome [Spirochaeta sp.]
MQGIIYLHRRNLRLSDNPSLTNAVTTAQERGAWLLILALWEPKDDAVVPGLGRPRLGAHYRRVWGESVTELADSYGALGQRLVIATAQPAEFVATVQQEFAGQDTIEVVTTQIPGTEEIDELSEITRRTGIAVRTPGSTMLIDPDALSFSLEANSVPATFSSYRKRVERGGLQVSPVLPAPERFPSPPAWVEDLAQRFPPPAAGQAAVPPAVPPAARSADGAPVIYIDRGGEAAAQARLRDFVWDSGALRTYKETRNGLLGTHFSSRLSMPLAHGTLSGRQVYKEVQANEQALGANDSTYWLIFELLWRDFFHVQAYAWGQRFFHPEGYGRHARPLAPRGLATEYANEELVQQWSAGATGDALVDAAMRELATTGYISNRGRQNAASYLIYDLKQPWWLGAALFEHELSDYDPASNWGNWTYIAGVGADSRGGRHFNTAKQAEDYDPGGEYRAFWGSGNG